MAIDRLNERWWKLTLMTACSSKEKKYAHFVSQASWAGARIIQGQWTPQALELYDLLILTFSDHGKLGNLEILKEKSGVCAEEWEDILQYTSQVFASSTLSFGFVLQLMG